MRKLLSILLTLSLLLCFSPVLAEEAAATDIVIVYTTDVHCALEGDITYAKVAAMKADYQAAGCAVALVDAGDATQGGPIGTLTKGEYLVDIMNKAGYDVAVPGNHEFDYGMEAFLSNEEKAAFSWVSCNLTDLRTGEAVLPGWKILEMGGKKVAFVGITTPTAITSSSPTSFKDADGEYIYGLCQDKTGDALYQRVQASVDEARGAGADYVIALAHLGVETACIPYMSTDVLLNTHGIDAMIDGHAHVTFPSVSVLNDQGEKVLLTSCGTKMSAAGVVTISKDGISAKLVRAYEGEDADVAAYVAEIEGQFEDLLGQVVAKSDCDLTIMDPATQERMVRSQETNLGDLCADAYCALTGSDVAFVNGGGIRADIPAGEITYGAIITVHPFGNSVCMVEATGQELLDALEMGARVFPDQNGGFLQVSGLTYEIDPSVTSTVTTDESGSFTGVSGEYRVKNVKVGGEALDLQKTYTLSSHDYMLKSGGDGMSMFTDNKLLLDCVALDNQCLIDYITLTLGGTVGDAYADPYGQGRITILGK